MISIVFILAVLCSVVCCASAHEEQKIDPSFVATSPTNNPRSYPTARPSFPPTVSPSRPTVVPTSARPSVSQNPSRSPTLKPTSVGVNFKLFAVLNGTNCGQKLPYGPSEITNDGSSDGYNAYLSTNTSDKNVLHTEWLQIMNDGVNEVFRIYWIFATPRKLADHFIAAVSTGVPVSYRVESRDSGKFSYNGTWWFSDLAGNMSKKFAATTSTVGFSDKYGLWGGGQGVIDGASYDSNPKTINLWGAGNYRSLDGDFYACEVMYEKGDSWYSMGTPGVRTYLYYSNTL